MAALNMSVLAPPQKCAIWQLLTMLWWWWVMAGGRDNIGEIREAEEPLANLGLRGPGRGLL